MAWGVGFAAALTASLSACEAIVPGTVERFACEGADRGTCPAGKYCHAGTCVVCLANDPCDGEDNDNSGVPDDAPDTCPSGEYCAAIPADATSSTRYACVRRIEGGGLALPLGALCARDIGCTSGVCGTSATLLQAVTDAVGNVCTSPCCTSGDCPDGFVCHSAGTGGNYCVSAGVLAVGAVGMKLGGEACRNGNECRSGRCNDAGHCDDTCCSDTTCAPGSRCALAETSFRVPPATSPTKVKSMVCVPSDSAALRELYEPCDGNRDCRSGMCRDLCAGALCRVCVAPCCSSSACGAYTSSQLALPIALSCGRSLDDGVLVASCSRPITPEVQAHGRGAIGAPCTDDSGCASGWCDVRGQVCTDVCCVNSDCNGLACRPDTSPGRAGLRCQKS